MHVAYVWQVPLVDVDDVVVVGYVPVYVRVFEMSDDGGLRDYSHCCQASYQHAPSSVTWQVIVVPVC